MSLIAIILILLSAVLHAGWNLVCKKEYPTAALFFASYMMQMVLLAPVIIYFWRQIFMIQPAVWLLLGLTGFFMALYDIMLAGAYRHGDISLAYPLARSSPIIVVTVVTLLLGEGRQIGNWAVLGIVLTVAGCFFLPMKAFGEFRLRNYLNPCCIFALLAAVGTAGYTIVDSKALGILRKLPGMPLNPFQAAMVYYALQIISGCCWLGMGILGSRNERDNLGMILAASKKTAAIMGIGIAGGYILILTSMAYVNNVSYVAAFRQVSILIAALMGLMVFKEPFYPPKLLGTIIVFIGLILVGVG